MSGQRPLPQFQQEAQPGAEALSVVEQRLQELDIAVAGTKQLIAVQFANHLPSNVI